MDVKIKKFASLFLFFNLLTSCSLQPYQNEIELKIEDPSPVVDKDFNLFPGMYVTYPNTAEQFACYGVLAIGPAIPNKKPEPGKVINYSSFQAGNVCDGYPGVSSTFKTSLTDTYGLSVPQGTTSAVVLGFMPKTGFSCPVGSTLDYFAPYNYDLKPTMDAVVPVTNISTFFPVGGQTITLTKNYNSATAKDINNCNNSYSSPSAINGLSNWLRADFYTSSGSIGNTAPQWADNFLGKTYNNLSTYYPGATTNGFGTHSKVTFGGTGQTVNLSGGFNSPANGVSVIAVIKSNGNPGGPTSIVTACNATYCSGVTSQTFRLQLGPGSPGGLLQGEYHTGTTNTVTGTHPLDTTNYHIVGLTGGSPSSGSIRIRIDGASEAVNNAMSGVGGQSITPALGFSVGADVSGPATTAANAAIDLIELLVYNNEIPDSAFDYLECYLSQTYGITISHGC